MQLSHTFLAPRTTHLFARPSSCAGQVTYAEFVPLCYQILVEILREEIVASQKSPTQLEEYLMDLMSASDPDGSGLLPASTIKDVLRAADFGLTRLQIHTVLAEAEEGDDGLVEYAAFAPLAADLIYRLLDSAAQADKIDVRAAATAPSGLASRVLPREAGRARRARSCIQI